MPLILPPLPMFLLPIVLLLSQCAPTGQQPVKNVVKNAVAISAERWVKISANPPTFYPRGVAAGVQTDFRSGEWVSTEDDHGTRFFIPFKGIPGGQREALLQEALAHRSDRKRSRIAEEDRVKPEVLVTTAALMPIIIPAMTAVAVIAPWWYFRDRWPEGHS